MIHIYYGDGKGKTSAALGLGMRAFGAGKKVAMVQFLKNNQSSELAVLPFAVYEAPQELPFHPDKSYQEWVDGALAYLLESDAEILILDEFLDVIFDFVTEGQAFALLEQCDKEIVVTGHRDIPSLTEKADYITYMQKIRHPYDQGVSARKGIEY